MDANNTTQAPSKSGPAIAALVLGIVALITSFLPIINNVSFFLALIGLVLAIVAIVGIRKGKKVGMGMAVASLVICIVAGGAVLGTQAMYSAAIDEASNQLNNQLDRASGDATDEILGTDVEVNFGEYSLSEGEYGLVESSLPVTVKNLTSETQSFNIHIEATDASGARIMDDYVLANSLGSDRSQSFEAFQYVASENVEAMKDAQFNIVQIQEY